MTEAPRILFQGRFLRAMGTGLDRARIVVTFDHRQKDKTAFEDYRPFERALDAGAGHLAISSAANDWFLNAETGALASALRDASARWEASGIGFSMGGYGAMRFAADLCMARMILFAPQFSILPQHPPGDPRYASYAVGLDPALDAIPPSGATEGLVFYDPRLQPVDRLHADLICAHFPRLRRAALPFGGHPPLNNFDRRNGYGRIVGAFIDGTLDAALVRRLHRAARPGSDRYQTHLTRYLARRAARSDQAAP